MKDKVKYTAKNHKPNKRKNIGSWMESRLRRLEVFCDTGTGLPGSGTASLRQRDRATMLANAIQVYWAKRSVVK
jgi:mannitol-specific phosphotransferase system IIBC component